MLSIGPMGFGSDEYYLFLAQEDYYLNGGEPPGRWWGVGAAHLGLQGQVTKDQLALLMNGFSPDGKALVQNAGVSDRRPGFDLTFSAPKPVSALWAIGTDQIRAEIDAAHAAGVIAGMDYMQAEAGMCRKGHEGKETVKARLVACLFNHCTSRALDPQVHTHALLMNIGVMQDGSTNALFHPLTFRHKMAAGAIYRAELAAQLQERLGLKLERSKFAFEIVGVVKDLLKVWSTRRAQIEEKLGPHGIDSAVAAAAACKASREPKTVVPPRIDLFKAWQQTAAEHGVTPEKIADIVHRSSPIGREKHLDSIVDLAINRLTEQFSHFRKRDLVRHAAEAAQTLGLGGAEVRNAVEKAMNKHPRLVVQGEDRLTTKEVLKIERQMLRRCKIIANKSQTHGVDEAVLDKVMRNFEPPARVLVQQAERMGPEGPSRNAHSYAEQIQAVRRLTEKGGGLRILQGVAGSGKTSTLGMSRAVWEEGGYTVIGAAVANKAARELQNRAGIKSMSAAKLLHRMDDSFAKKWKHHARMIGREALKKNTYKFEPLKLDERTVVVLDEASMLDTRTLAKIVEHVKRANATLVLVGDRNQLQSIGPGGGYAHLADSFDKGKSNLKVNVRQRIEADREAVNHVLEGDTIRALKNLADRDRLVLAPNHKGAIAQLVDDWFQNERGRFHEVLIFAPTRNGVTAINEACQAKRLSEGSLDPDKFANGTFVDPKTKAESPVVFHVGDRVLLHKNNRMLDVDNGDMGTVVKIGRTLKLDRTLLSAVVTVELDRGQRVVIPLKDYQSMTLGYAITTHKGQGTTAERAYILASGGTQDREMTFTQLTRAKFEMWLYASELEAGPELRDLAGRMNRSGAKTLATELKKPTQLEELQQPGHTFRR